jgi:hypothetical protein
LFLRVFWTVTWANIKVRQRETKMRVVTHGERVREVRFINASGKLLIVLSYNCLLCTHLKNTRKKK